MKIYWLKEEIPIADELVAAQSAMREEFIRAHPELAEDKIFDCVPITKVNKHSTSVFDKDIINENKDIPWKGVLMKYTDEKVNILRNYYEEDPTVAEKYPTAAALTKKYGNDCAISGYSIFEKNTVIHRHTGLENRDNEYLRIHIPIIIPEGDVFFECEGVEIDWSDIWGFNNQLIHSAYNNTNKIRIIYLIDIRRSAIGLPPEPPYDPKRELGIPPFVRGALPKMLHTCQKNKI